MNKNINIFFPRRSTIFRMFCTHFLNVYILKSTLFLLSILINTGKRRQKKGKSKKKKKKRRKNNRRNKPFLNLIGIRIKWCSERPGMRLCRNHFKTNIKANKTNSENWYDFMFTTFLFFFLHQIWKLIFSFIPYPLMWNIKIEHVIAFLINIICLLDKQIKLRMKGG